MTPTKKRESKLTTILKWVVGCLALVFFAVEAVTLEPHLRKIAVGQAGSFGAATVPLLLQRVRDDPDEDVRLTAMTTLVGIGARAVPSLTEALHSSDALTRGNAADILARIGPPGEPATPALLELLKDEDKQVRNAAASALAAVSPASQDMVPIFVKMLKDEDARVRLGGAEALSALGPRAATAVAALIEALDDKDVEIRQEAAEALANIGPDAKIAVPALVEAIKKEKDPNARKEMADGLRLLDEEAAQKLTTPAP